MNNTDTKHKHAYSHATPHPQGAPPPARAHNSTPHSISKRKERQSPMTATEIRRRNEDFSKEVKQRMHTSFDRILEALLSGIIERMPKS